MEFIYLDAHRRAEWDRLVATNPASGFMQSFAWADFKRRTGWETYKIGILEKDKLVGGCIALKYPFSKTKNFIHIPQGPVLPYEIPKRASDFFTPLMAELDSVADLRGVSLTAHLRIEPRLAEAPDYFSRLGKAPFNIEPRDTLIMGLDQEVEKILAGMKPKGRYNVGVAERSGIVVSVENAQEATLEFMSIYRETVKRNQFEGKSPAYLLALLGHLRETGLGDLFVARANGRMLAGAIVIFFGGQATYFFGASSDEKREVMAPYKLHFEIMCEAKRRGCRVYDFWGIAPKDAPSGHAWKGITEFKRKFGGRELRFCGAYDFVYDKKMYQEFLRESGEV